MFEFNENFDDNEIFLYTLISYLSLPFQEDLYTSLSLLHKQLKNNINSEIDKRVSNNYKIALLNLEKKGMIKIQGSLINKNSVFKITLLNKTGFFVKVYAKDFNKILNIKNANISKLLRYYVTLLTTINSNYLVGWTTINRFSYATNISIKSIYHFNNLLEEHKIIYIKRNDPYLNESDSYMTRFPNIYGRYRDKNIVQNFTYTDF